MNIVLLISAFLYTALLMSAWLGLRRLLANEVQNITKSPNLTISVVVPFRNEAGNLTALFRDLQQQSYPHFEVIFVDDHSEDTSAEIVATLIKQEPKFYLDTLRDEFGKKSALSVGIDRAQGEVIVTADADVQVPNSWLATIAQTMVDQKADMLILPLKVTQDLSNGWPFFQAAENCAVQGLGFGLAAWGWPISCNGANLAFRKEAFQSCGGYSAHRDSASGDDVMLMQELLRKGFRVVPVVDQKALATTVTQPDWKSVFSQRMRWAGKTGRMNNGPTVLTGLILLLNALVLMMAVFVPTTDWSIWLGGLLLKVMLDVLLIKTIEKSFSQRLNPLKLALIAVAYIFYLPIVTVLSATWKPTWKGRKI